MGELRVRESLLRHWPWLLLVVLSLALHLWGLGERTLHHDESIHAKLSWDLATSGAYRYDPTYHGPPTRWILCWFHQ